MQYNRRGCNLQPQGSDILKQPVCNHCCPSFCSRSEVEQWNMDNISSLLIRPIRWSSFFTKVEKAGSQDIKWWRWLKAVSLEAETVLASCSVLFKYSWDWNPNLHTKQHCFKWVTLCVSFQKHGFEAYLWQKHRSTGQREATACDSDLQWQCEPLAAALTAHSWTKDLVFSLPLFVFALSKGLSFLLAAGTAASYYHTAIDSSLSVHLFYRTGECRCSISSRCQSSSCVNSTKPKRTESRPGPGRRPPTSSWPRHALHHSPQQTHHSTTGHDDSDS